MISQDIIVFMPIWLNNRLCNSSFLLSLIGLYLGHIHACSLYRPAIKLKVTQFNPLSYELPKSVLFFFYNQ